MSKRNDIISAKSREWKKKADLLDGDVLRSPAAVKFLSRFDDLCRQKIESALCCFNNHSEPLINKIKMQPFLDEAPSVFWGLWEFLKAIRGVKNGNEKKQDR